MTVNAVRLNHAVLSVATRPGEVRRWVGVRTAVELAPVEA